MTAKKQIQSTDISQTDSTIEHDFNEMTASSSDQTAYKSRFFRTKRKQRLYNNQIDINGQSAKEISTSNIRSVSPLLFTNENHSSIEQKHPLPVIYPAYQRKKSHSVKLTSLDENGLSPKKSVRFADDFGLNLSQIKMIYTDELPFIPSEAFKDLHINEHVKVITYMEPQFENPFHTHSFNDRLSRYKIVLEQANVIDNRIYGSVRLISLSLHKRIKIRLTTDNWISFRDHDAKYIINSYDGTCDRFSFLLEIDPHRIFDGNNIQFCLCYEVLNGPEYWDNNSQQNYRFNCFSRTVSDYSI